MHLIYC